MTCTLRPWRLSDADSLAISLKNPVIQNNLRDGIPYPYTREDAIWFIQEMLTAKPGSVYPYAITVEDRAVGSIAVTRGQNIHSRTGELGYYLAKEYWGRGLGSSAIRQACRAVFGSSDLLRIYAEPFTHNTASRRALEKAGFTHEGTLRQNAVKCGRVIDMELYSLLREECPDAKQ